MTDYYSTQKGCVGIGTKTNSAENDGKIVDKKGSVFSNEELLGIIFEHLSLEDLKSARQVNHLWNVEATKVLVHKYRTKPIQIFYNKVKLPTYLEGKKVKNPSMSLNAFSKFIEKSTSFPSSIKVYRIFRSLRPAQKENAIYLFKWYGHIFKSLEFSEEITEENRNFMQQLLTQMLPNLQVLTINECPNNLFVNTSTCSNEVLHFGKLKTLHLVGSAISPLCLSTVLRISKKLENIYFWQGSAYYENVIASYQKLKELNALHLLRSLDLYFDNSSLNFLESLSSDKHLTNLKIISELAFDQGLGEDEIEFPLDWARVGRILTAFFRNICNTLESMKEVNLLGKIPIESLTLPVFPNITRLDFYCGCYYEDNPIPVFPCGVELSRIFPCLKSIDLDIRAFKPENMCFSNLFPGNQSPLLTVSNLQINDSWKSGTFWEEFASLMFPNAMQ